MVNSDLIIRYTTALYRSSPENSPSYNEFRDMFSEGQLKSKFWLVNELKKTGFNFESVIIVGSWFSTLAFFILQVFPDSKIKCVDIDPRCLEFLKALTDFTPASSHITGVTADLRGYMYSENLIINTSCEHLQELNVWLQSIPANTFLVLQSSNQFGHEQHVNCADSLDEFKKQVSDHVSIQFAGELKLEIYTRHMIIGKKK